MSRPVGRLCSISVLLFKFSRNLFNLEKWFSSKWKKINIFNFIFPKNRFSAAGQTDSQTDIFFHLICETNLVFLFIRNFYECNFSKWKTSVCEWHKKTLWPTFVGGGGVFKKLDIKLTINMVSIHLITLSKTLKFMQPRETNAVRQSL